MTFEESNAEMNTILDQVTKIIKDSGYEYCIALRSADGRFGCADGSRNPQYSYELVMDAFAHVFDAQQQESKQ